MEDQKFWERGDPNSINPELGIEKQAELLPYDVQFEFPKEKLVIGLY